MLRPIMTAFASLVIVFGIGDGAQATFHWEISEPAGVNMIQFSVWADAGSAQLGIPIQSGVANTSVSNFGGNLSSGDQITIASLDGLNGFSAIAPASGTLFSASLGFSIANFTGGVVLPNTATSAANSFPVLKATYTSDKAGTFDALINDPVGGSFDSTVINASVANVTGSSGAASFSAIPEPSSFVMMGLVGMVGAGFVRIRRWLSGMTSE